LIQSGIHAGEIDGKDASLMLMRDIAITRDDAHLLDSMVLLFIPIFNVDGHERFAPYHRINQNGPEEMGWRVTAQNLNLNRDYMKADTPEMRALLSLFSTWLPDFIIDCHVTDGIDFQYDVTYSTETAGNIEPFIGRWISGRLIPGVLTQVEAAGHKIFPYVSPREDNDLSRGLEGGVIGPRLATGYAAIQNRPALLVETHALKPYHTRVDATYHLIKSTIAVIGRAPYELRSVVRRADQATVEAGKFYREGKTLPVTFGLGEAFEMRTFLGYTAHLEHSEVSGSDRRIYTHEPVETEIPYFHQVIVRDSVSIPLAYLIPQEWRFVADIMKVHGIQVERLVNSVTLEVESYRLSDVKFTEKPY